MSLPKSLPQFFFKLQLFILVFSFAVVDHAALAEVVVSLDLHPSSPTTAESSASGFVGDSFNINVLLQLNDLSDSVANYNLTVRYNTMEFDLSGLIINSPPPGFFALGVPSVVEDASDTDPVVGPFGEIRDINGQALLNGVSGVSSYVVSTFTLTSISPTSFSPNLSVGLLRNGFDVLQDNRSQNILAVFENATIAVTAVPEPSCMAFLAFGAIGVGVARLRRKGHVRLAF